MIITKKDRERVFKTYTPGSGEEEDDFISRCISGEADAHPEWTDDQRVAVCYDAWRDSNKAEESMKVIEKAIKSIDKAIDSLNSKKIPVEKRQEYLKQLLFKKLKIYKAELERLISKEEWSADAKVKPSTSKIVAGERIEGVSSEEDLKDIDTSKKKSD